MRAVGCIGPAQCAAPRGSIGTMRFSSRRVFPKLALSFLIAGACGAGCSSSGTNDLDVGGGPGGGLDGGGLGGEGGVPVGDGGAGVDTGSVGPAGIQGLVIARADRSPVAGRAIKIRDASGKTQDVTTDGAGAFSASNVTSPYDLYIAPSGTSSNAAGNVYLGVQTTKLKIWGDSADSPPVTPHAATTAISWDTPACTGGVCKVYLVVRTADGTETRALHPGYGPGPRTFNVNPTWMAGTGTTTTASVALLLSGSDGGSHYFATANVNLTQGQTVNVPLAPASVPVLGNGTLAATSSGTGTFNPPGGIARLVLPAPNGALEISTGTMTSPLPLRLPTIAGASLWFQITQLAPGSPFNSVGATQIGQAPSGQAYSVPLGEPFPIAAPAEHGSASIAGGSVDFHATTGPHVHLVQWIRLDSGPGMIVALSDPKLTLSRLGGLTPAVTAGPIQLVVEEHSRPYDIWLSDMTADANDQFASTSYEASFTP